MMCDSQYETYNNMMMMKIDFILRDNLIMLTVNLFSWERFNFHECSQHFNFIINIMKLNMMIVIMKHRQSDEDAKEKAWFDLMETNKHDYDVELKVYLEL